MNPLEIPKFRVWDKREGMSQMIYINGYKFYGEGFEGGNPEYKWCRIEQGKSAFSLMNVKDMEMMQYTFLNDKNGKPIYRGDILSGVAEIPVVITWSYKFASFCLQKDGLAFQHWFGESCDPAKTEVIGNIYENPELIK